MMAQYRKIKEQYSDCILFFRLGDFYEMFEEDAVIASKILDIVLTSRNKGEDQTPMCGVPYHAADNYLAKLTRLGKKVAICEQVSDPSLSGIVKREVTRVITPGTTLDENILEQKTNNYILSIYAKENYFGLSFADISTGEFRVSEINDLDRLVSELKRISPSEIIFPLESEQESWLKKIQNILQESYFYPFKSNENSYQLLTEFFQTKSLEGFGAEKLPFGIQAAGRLILYLKETQKNELKHIQKLISYSCDEYMMLDESTIRNLELVKNSIDGEKRGSLLESIDHTLTSMGGRLLKRWVLKPLVKLNQIQNRLEGVEELYRNQKLMFSLKEILLKIFDIERIISRLSLGSGNARDLQALKESLKQIPHIKTALLGTESTILRHIRDKLEAFDDLTELIEKGIVSDPPIGLKEGGIIRDGYHGELDELKAISRDAQEILRQIQEREADRTGISSLKVSFNKIFGYYIEISKVHLKKVPQDYIRKQTLVNVERYITQELKELEEKILRAEEKMIELEYKLFQEIRGQTLEKMHSIQEAGYKIAFLDVILNFAINALSYKYCKPEIRNAAKIFIKDGRHPVIEKIFNDLRFVANDTLLDSNENQFMLITGPNMAGKSVYLRQVALITLLAHIGSFVPASEAQIGLVDRIFTRVGASDNILKGQSTFMVEMEEAANILNHATQKSLILLDEIGRGTSTYDGVSIAWAVTEYIHDTIKAKTIFATHYHELIAVTERLKGAKNFSAKVKETIDGIIFLYKIEKGAIDRSYGIEVARLAGIPAQVTQKAQQILEELEEAIVEKSIREKLSKKISDDQMGLFSQEGQRAKEALYQTFKSSRFTHPALEALKQVDINHLTPLEALQKLDELKKTCRS